MHTCRLTSPVWSFWVWTKSPRPRLACSENTIPSRFDSITGSLLLHPFSTCASSVNLFCAAKPHQAEYKSESVQRFIHSLIFILSLSSPPIQYVLAVGSSVFSAMFYGDLAEENSEIQIPDVEPAAFLILLK